MNRGAGRRGLRAARSHIRVLPADALGASRVTEINPRLAGRPWLYSNAGINLPLAAVRAMLGLPLGDALAPGGLAVGLHLYRQLDVEPTIGYPPA